jgi:hypothetical protein
MKLFIMQFSDSDSGSDESIRVDSCLEGEVGWSYYLRRLINTKNSFIVAVCRGSLHVHAGSVSYYFTQRAHTHLIAAFVTLLHQHWAVYPRVLRAVASLP